LREGSFAPLGQKDSVPPRTGLQKSLKNNTMEENRPQMGGGNTERESREITIRPRDLRRAREPRSPVKGYEFGGKVLGEICRGVSKRDYWEKWVNAISQFIMKERLCDKRGRGGLLTIPMNNASPKGKDGKDKKGGKKCSNNPAIPRGKGDRYGGEVKGVEGLAGGSQCGLWDNSRGALGHGGSQMAGRNRHQI